jgi:addiction module toxin, relE/stbE family
LNKYSVKIYSRAYQDLELIYKYIAEELLEPSTAMEIVEGLEKSIFSLEEQPERGTIRRIGAYANQGYRQIFYKNYTIIYRVVKMKNEVHIITVRYTPSNF